MGYEKELTEIDSHFAEIQRLLNSLPPPSAGKKKAFESIKGRLVTGCIAMNHAIAKSLT